jgi:hypothetical protein
MVADRRQFAVGPDATFGPSFGADIRGAAPRRIQSMHRTHQPIPRWRWLAAAFALAVAAVAGVAVAVAGSGGDDTRVSLSPSASAELELGDDGATLVLQGLPQPDGVYQAWIVRPGAEDPEPSVVFVPDETGRAVVSVPGAADAEAVLVNTEPLGGSTSPTSVPILTASLS